VLLATFTILFLASSSWSKSSLASPFSLPSPSLLHTIIIINIKIFKNGAVGNFHDFIFGQLELVQVFGGDDFYFGGRFPFLDLMVDELGFDLVDDAHVADSGTDEEGGGRREEEGGRRKRREDSLSLAINQRRKEGGERREEAEERRGEGGGRGRGRGQSGERREHT
jgi:hypothetical protein